MIKYFKDKLILTTQEPGGFINIGFEPGDTGVYSVYPDPSIEDENILYINGLDSVLYTGPSQDSSLNIHLEELSDPSTVSFFINTRKLDDFDYNIKIDLDGSTIADVSILNRPYLSEEGKINSYETSNVQLDDETSYLILRTNPKFTGNIKLIVDSSSRMYFDTFKVSDILSNRKYRKQKVSSESFISGDIRRVFSTLPLGEIYKLGLDDTYDIAIPKTELHEQYKLEYSYGARHFNDELYNESYSILSPLWINKNLPDYFTIFKIDGVYNPETYIENSSYELAKKYLKEGEIIKSWGIKEATPLGTYLRNHLHELLGVRSPLFLSLSNPELADPDPNTWYGIAVDKGIITGRSEIPYFFDQKDSFTETNVFVSEGFERLNLLCPNLINLEYAFNDPDSTMYTMNRYFGLYLTENELYKISYYAENPDASIQVLSLDNKDSSVFFNSTIFDPSYGNVEEKYENRLFTLNDIEKIKRITNVNEVNGSEKEFIEEWLNKPGENIFSVDVTDVSTTKFVTFKLENLLGQGEHLRIIDKTNFKIWEVYSIKSDIIEKGESWTYSSTYEDPSNNYPTIYRTCFSSDGSIADQIRAIKSGFDIFKDYEDTPFETTILKEDNGQLSLKLKEWANNYDIHFQRLTAQTLEDAHDPSSNFNSGGAYNDISFFGVLTPTVDDFEQLSYDASYGPINFELYGDRMSITLNFLEQEDENNLYTFSAEVETLFEDQMMYLGDDDWYRLVIPFSINTQISHKFNYVTDPHRITDNLIIKTSNKIQKTNGKWNAYTTYPLTISLMGINPIKDMDYTIYDASIDYQSEYFYNREDDASTYYLTINQDTSSYINIRNSFEIISGTGNIEINGNNSSFSASSVDPFYFNTFDGSAYINPSTKVIVTYNQLDGSMNYKGYKSDISEEDLDDYYTDPETKRKLKYSLTLPYITKWVGNGTDVRNNSLRLMLDDSLLDLSEASTNFIPLGENFNQELTYPSFKYLSSGERAWKDYVYFDINDIVYYENENITLRELMFKNPYIDVFSKILYSNSDVNEVTSRSSITYFNSYKESIDTIIKGLNLSFTLSEGSKNIFNIRDWDRYRVSFISSPSRNKYNNSSIEVFINENTDTILLVWYQGNDILNYNKRYSSIFGGKGLLDTSIGGPMEFSAFKPDDENWSHVKTPFIVNTSSPAIPIKNIYGIDASYAKKYCSPLLQLNYNIINNVSSVFNVYSNNNTVSDNSFIFNYQYNTFNNEYIEYNYSAVSSTFGLNIINQTYTYLTNENLYIDNVCNLETFKYLTNLNTNIEYYIFRGNEIYSNKNFNIAPVKISINEPKKYKELYTYNGWYKPKFKDILKFNYNEDETILNTLQKDFIYANTNLSGYSHIDQYWYNKVVDEVSSEDVSIANAIDYIQEFDVFKSLWDSNYFILNENSTKELIDGYNSAVELPSFFGSKLTKLPKTLNLETWDARTANSTEGTNWHTLEYNITRRIINFFKEIPQFINNWSPLTSSDNIIDNYVKQTILKYYNISKHKIRTEIWTKPYNGRRFEYSLDDSFIKDDALNVDALLNFVNDEYVYSLKVPIRPNLTYFIKIVLFEK